MDSRNDCNILQEKKGCGTSTKLGTHTVLFFVSLIYFPDISSCSNIILSNGDLDPWRTEGVILWYLKGCGCFQLLLLDLKYIDNIFGVRRCLTNTSGTSGQRWSSPSWSEVCFNLFTDQIDQFVNCLHIVL